MIKELESIAKNVFGKNNVDVLPTTMGGNVYDFTILFPKIEIINSNGLFHTIHELFVRFNITVNNDSFRIYESQLMGTRGARTLKEYASGYMHSHLPSCGHWCFPEDSEEWREFCLGASDSPMRMILNELSCEDTQDTIQFEMLCLQIAQYVRWESLEGGPHIRMEHIGTDEEQSESDKWYNDLESVFEEVRKLDEPIIGFVNEGNFPVLRVKNIKKLTEIIDEKTSIPGKRLEGKNFAPNDNTSKNTAIEDYKSWIKLSSSIKNPRRGHKNRSFRLTPIFKFKGQPVYERVLRPPFPGLEQKKKEEVQFHEASFNQIRYTLNELELRFHSMVARSVRNYSHDFRNFGADYSRVISVANTKKERISKRIKDVKIKKEEIENEIRKQQELVEQAHNDH